MPEVTQDYEVFEKHAGNREVDDKAVKKLMESIKEKNMLMLRPIIVDKNLKVIDGNHRLEAAKRMQIPVYYVVDETLESQAMYLLNNAQKNWTLSDYLNYYVNQGNEEYIKLNQFISKEKTPLNIAFQLLNGSRSGGFFKTFRDGKYVFPDEKEFNESMEKKERILETIDYIKRKTSGLKLYLSRVTFYSALVEFFNIKSFDYTVFMTKLQYKLDLIRPCSKQCDYVKIFKEIYNWKNKEPLKVET